MKILIEEQVVQQALDALHRGRQQIIGVLVQQDQDQAITALSTALDAAEKVEPVAWMLGDSVYPVKQCRLLTNPPGQEVPGQIPLYDLRGIGAGKTGDGS